MYGFFLLKITAESERFHFNFNSGFESSCCITCVNDVFTIESVISVIAVMLFTPASLEDAPQ